MAPDASLPSGIIDFKRALIWVKKNIETYGGDPRQIFLSGDSAGGNLSALLGVTSDDNFDESLRNEDTAVQGVIPLYGVFDFSDSEGHYSEKFPKTTMSDRVIRSLLETIMFQKKFETNRELFDGCSPMYHATAAKDVLPFLIMHGTKDALTSWDDSEMFFKALGDMRRRSR